MTAPVRARSTNAVSDVLEAKAAPIGLAIAASLTLALAGSVATAAIALAAMESL